MAVQFLCAACKQPIEVDDDMANQAVTCPYCRKVVTAPVQSDAAVSPEAPTARAAECGAATVPTSAPGVAPRAMGPRKSSLLGWIALGCAVASAITIVYIMWVSTSMMEGIDMETTPPDEVKRIINEKLRNRPSLQVLGLLSSCVVPLVGFICAIITLAKGYRPRWPAILALVSLGLLLVLVCAGFLLQVVGMSGPPPGG